MAFRAWQFVLGSQSAHLRFGQVADGEDDLAELRVGDATQKVCLVFEGVSRRAEPKDAVFVLP